MITAATRITAGSIQFELWPPLASASSLRSKRSRQTHIPTIIAAMGSHIGCAVIASPIPKIMATDEMASARFSKELASNAGELFLFPAHWPR